MLQLSELGRPFTGGSWCGTASGPQQYFSETSTVTASVKVKLSANLFIFIDLSIEIRRTHRLVCICHYYCIIQEKGTLPLLSYTWKFVRAHTPQEHQNYSISRSLSRILTLCHYYIFLFLFLFCYLFIRTHTRCFTLHHFSRRYLLNFEYDINF